MPERNLKVGMNQNQNEKYSVSEVENALNLYCIESSKRYEELPSQLKDIIHGEAYENCLTQDDIIGFMCGYLEAKRKSQIEIEELKAEISKWYREWYKTQIKLNKAKQLLESEGV